MADRPTVRDDERLPWLEPNEGERRRGRRPVSRGALVGLLVAFLGIGLAVAFSLGYRVARPTGEVPAQGEPAQPQRSASVQLPLTPPAAAPKVEQVATEQPVVQPPVAEPKPAVTTKPAVKKARVVHHKARPRHVWHRRPILRPFIDVKKRAPIAQPTPYQAPPPTPPPPPPPGPRGKMVQLGAYSTMRQADQAWRSMAWRYPYLGKKPRVVVPTKPIGGWTYYRLRLGTESQAQSLVICQFLQSRGQSCIVVY